MKTFFASMAALLVFTGVALPAFATSPAVPLPTLPDECAVTGRVVKVEAVQKSPWNDGTPTTLTTTEIRLHIDIESREGSKECTPYTDKTPRIYKQCSPTRVAVGDRIKGTEGLATGNAQAVACLFDVALIEPPKKTSP